MSLNGDNCYPIDVAENANLENLGDLYMKIKNQDNVDSSFPDGNISLQQLHSIIGNTNIYLYLFLIDSLWAKIWKKVYFSVYYWQILKGENQNFSIFSSLCDF